MASFSLLSVDRDYGRATVANGNNLKAWVDFDPDGADCVVVKVGLSTTSLANARANMAHEAPGWDFDGFVGRADAVWDGMLGRIKVKGDSTEMQKFYTALYHTMIQPNVISDINGEYTSTDYSTQKMPHGQQYYTTF